MKSNVKMGIALGGFLVAASLATNAMAQAAKTTTPTGDSGKCMGANACKGTSACKTASSSCKGTNSCKGKGWTESKKSDCKGTWEAMNTTTTK